MYQAERTLFIDSRVMPRGKVRETSGYRRGTIGLGRYAFLFSSSPSILPPPYSRNGPSSPTLPFDTAAPFVRGKNPYGPPTTIQHRCTSRSLRRLAPRSPNVDLRYCTRGNTEIGVMWNINLVLLSMYSRKSWYIKSFCLCTEICGDKDYNLYKGNFSIWIILSYIKSMSGFVFLLTRHFYYKLCSDVSHQSRSSLFLRRSDHGSAITHVRPRKLSYAFSFENRYLSKYRSNVERKLQTRWDIDSLSLSTISTKSAVKLCARRL